MYIGGRGTHPLHIFIRIFYSSKSAEIRIGAVLDLDGLYWIAGVSGPSGKEYIDSVWFVRLLEM